MKQTMQLGKIIHLPKVADPRGNLTFCEGGEHIPFDVKRVYWVYDVPGGGRRGGHAHRELRQLLVAVNGSFTVTLDNGERKETVMLNHPWEGLLIEAGLWRTMDDFSSGAVCMVLASDKYDESDYIRNYRDFKRWVRSGG